MIRRYTLLFQVLDYRKECVGLFYDGKILQEIPNDLSKTWKYCDYLPDDIEYASLYCDGNTLDVVCPEYLKIQWLSVSNKMKAFMRSFREAKISLEDNCFFDLVPSSFLIDYFHVKNLITEHVFENYTKPKNYNFLLSLTKFVESVGNRPLNISTNRNIQKSQDIKIAKFVKNNSDKRYIDYNVFGTKTGRLTTKKNSFPILTFEKQFRSALKPNNDWFLEFDFNAAELRTLLALSGQEQPQIDIHEWNAKNVFNGKLDREEVKKRTFAWLYNPQSQDSALSKKYNRELVVKKYSTQSQVTTFFDRTIESDPRRALNYIIQSTTSDLFLRRVLNVDEVLKSRKSYISFTLHDSVVIDYAEEDKDILSELINVFSNTELGFFKVNVSAGKNFGNMEPLRIRN